MAGSTALAFVQGCLPNATVPPPLLRDKEVSDGQPHAILHRRRLGRSRRQEVHPRRQSGDRRSDVRSCARLEGRPRQGRCRRQARLPDLFADQPRGARRAAGKDHRGLQGPHEGNRRRRIRRDGRAAADGRTPAGRRRPRPYRFHAGSPQELSFRRDRRFGRRRARAGRRHRHDHALELAAEPDRLQGRARARRRLHHDPQAVGIHPVLGADLRGNPP